MSPQQRLARPGSQSPRTVRVCPWFHRVPWLQHVLSLPPRRVLPRVRGDHGAVPVWDIPDRVRGAAGQRLLLMRSRDLRTGQRRCHVGSLYRMCRWNLPDGGGGVLGCSMHRLRYRVVRANNGAHRVRALSRGHSAASAWRVVQWMVPRVCRRDLSDGAGYGSPGGMQAVPSGDLSDWAGDDKPLRVCCMQNGDIPAQSGTTLRRVLCPMRGRYVPASRGGVQLAGVRPVRRRVVPVSSGG